MSTHDGRMLVALVAVVALVGALVVGASVSTVATEEPDLACVGTGGGAAYVTDTGLTITENDTAAGVGTFYAPDEETFRFEYEGDAVNISAAGNGKTRLESFTGNVTCLGDINATENNITVAPDDDNDVTLSGEFEGFAFRDAVFGSEDSRADVVYEATTVDSLTVAETGLEDGTKVYALEATNRTLLDSATVDDGAVTFDGLPNPEHVVDLTTERSEVEGCVDRRDISRGQEDQGCPKDSTIGRGGSRDELDRNTGRGSDTSRRDRGRRGRGR